MKKVKFYLKDPKSKNPSLIYLFWSFNGQRLKYSTGEFIKPSDWNPNPITQRVKKPVTGSNEINAYLDKLSEDVLRIYRTGSLNNDTISTDYIRAKLDELHKGKSQKFTLFTFIASFIETIKSQRTTGTIQIYNNTLKQLKEFKEYSRKPLDFHNINLDFYSDFTDFLIRQKKLSSNTIGKSIKTLKTFLNEATERGLNTNLDYKSKRFKVTQQDSESIYLSVDEIQLLSNLDLSKDSKLENVRDLFIVGCYTGLRFSDLSQLKSENINNGFIKIRTQKTNEVVIIPLNQLVIDILKKYNGELPNCISNQKTNLYLKNIGELAKLNDKVEISVNKGNLTTKSFKNKFNLITTHTARRSFATNLYLQGFPTVSIMKITGHKTEKAFMKYLKITTEQNAELLAEFWKENTKLKLA